VTERLFFALWPDERQRTALTRVQGELPDHGGRKTHPEDFHLTLVFLGDLDAQRRACAEEVAGRVRGVPFVLNLDRRGYFPRAGVLWCGASAWPQPLLDLVQALNDGLRGCGFRPERRAFVPHVTLARKARPLPARDIEPPVVWPVAAFSLVIARPGECPSTPYHLIFGSQRGERRPDARRASAGIASPLSSSRNTADGRLLSRPKGASQNAPRRCYSAWQEGELFPARCALPWRVWEALRAKNKVKWGTRYRVERSWSLCL